MIDTRGQGMKRLFLRLFLHERFLGQLAAAAAAALAAYLLTLIPGAPALVETLIATLLQLPEGTELTQTSLTAALTPLFLALINAIVQELVIRDNNRALDTLQDTGLYPGKKDGWIGPIAQGAIKVLSGNPDR